MPTTWYDSTVVKIEPAAPNVRRFWLETPGVAKPAFRAGQFITLDLPIGEKRLERWRSYSIANAPHDDGDALELCIVHNPAGRGTNYLFNEVREGAVLRWKGPEGAFTLPESIERDLVLVCTGTGVAPFRSMLRQVWHSGMPHRRIHLIFGARTQADILYREEFEAMARRYPEFRYDIALSRDPDWTGYRGHVHQLYLEHYGAPRPDVAFYLCGWSRMIDESVANLQARGYAREQVFYELYG